MASTTLEPGRYGVTTSRSAPRYRSSLLEASLDPLVTTADGARKGEVALEMFVAGAYDVVLMAAHSRGFARGPRNSSGILTVCASSTSR